ncbi:MAG: hypothetical protein IPL46_25480 [Saprospiraceae bacterium]|nr:hypothetical protein [Saprospiraceae bacterium]
MKISTLSSICFLFCWSSIQTQKIVPLSFSPKIGINFNDFIIDDSSDPALSLARMGWNIGIDANYGHRLQAQAGLHFFRLGTGIEMMKDTGIVTERVSTSQFKIPLGVSYRVCHIDYFNLWLHSQLVINLTTKVVNGSAEAETRIYPRSGLGGRVGIGMDLGRFTLEVNYEGSFTEMLKQSFDARSKLINMSVGLRF